LLILSCAVEKLPADESRVGQQKVDILGLRHHSDKVSHRKGALRFKYGQNDRGAHQYAPSSQLGV
jgi:hypothetical protein